MSESPLRIGVHVPWNAGWSSEESYEIRPCRWVGGKLALWSPHTPGIGKPVFARPHMVRQRQSIAKMLCTVCGKPTLPSDRWWFRLGNVQEGYFMTTEAPVHRTCADHSLSVCPHLRGRSEDLELFPGGHVVLASKVGGPATERDFGITMPAGGVIGHLKIAWPMSKIKFAERPSQAETPS